MVICDESRKNRDVSGHQDIRREEDDDLEIRVTDRSGLAGGSGNAAAAKACAGGGKTASASSGTSALSVYAANRLNQYSNITYQSNSLSPSYRRTARTAGHAYSGTGL